MVDKLFDMKTGYEVLAQELHKPMIKKFKRRKVYGRLRFRDNIWDTDLAEMGPLSSKN